MAIMYLLAPNGSAEGHQQQQQQQQGRSHPYHVVGPGSQAADDFDAHSTFGGSIMEEPDTPRVMDAALPNGTPQLRCAGTQACAPRAAPAGSEDAHSACQLAWQAGPSKDPQMAHCLSQYALISCGTNPILLLQARNSKLLTACGSK